MAEELDKILADADKSTAAPASGEKSPEQVKAEESKKAEDHLANIKKAIVEANEILRKARVAVKTGITTEEELPKIDFADPGSKAWDKHISERVDPLKDEISKEKEEIRTFALKEFLRDKPNLAKDSEALKRVMGTYEKIKTASERTKEGVLIDLSRAYAAEYHDEILEGKRQDRYEEAAGDAIFSDPGVSRGSTSYPQDRERNPHLSKDDEAILARWNMTPAEWIKQKKAQEKKT